MSVYTIIALVLFYAAMRAALRGKPADPMAGRLVPRGAYQQHAPARTQPATVAAPTHLQRLAEEFKADTYRRERARSRREFESNLTRYDR
jgi:hypothetical protein